MPRRLVDGRADDLLDGVMAIIAERGFSQVKIAEIAAQLRCSIATLYKVAPSKDDLVLLSIRRWGERTLDDIASRAAELPTPSERARAYFRCAAAAVGTLSGTFRADIDRFESTRSLWRTTVADPFVDHFTGLLDEAVDAGEIRPVNTRFLAEVLRRTGLVTRDEHMLTTLGLTAEEAIMEVDGFIWDGIQLRR